MKKIEFDKEYLEMMQTLPESMEEYQNWLGLKERKIYFNQEVDSYIVNKIVYWIQIWNKEDDENGLVGDERKPIRISLTSNGGDVVAGFAAIDAIKRSKTKVIIEGIGVCASMGALLLISGHERLAYPNTVILIHDGSLAVHSSSKKAKNTMNFYDRLDERVKNFIIENTNITKELYEEKEDEEWYMFANDEGIDLKIIDGLL
jgi:ATP-dependent Clp protease protease subunit